MRLRIAIVVVLLLSGSIAPALAEQDTTGGLRNGRYWQALSAETKADYLIGFTDGQAATLDWMMQENNSDQTKKTFQRIYAFYYSPSATFGETSKALDQFYGDPANLIIPIHLAMGYCAMKAKGASPDVLATSLATFRARSAKEKAKEQ